MYGLDLFSGIGGITKALEGYVQPIAYCENDRYAQVVLLSRMRTGDIPCAPIWDDVRTLRGSMCPPVEIVYGGFPCQDISVAGRGAGLEGKRSGLFFEIARLVGEIRPAFVFLENVPAIHLRGGDAVVGTLADLGYDCRWDVLSAADVGANHRRERWWLLGYAIGGGCCRESRGGAGTKSPNGHLQLEAATHSDAYCVRCKEQSAIEPAQARKHAQRRPRRLCPHVANTDKSGRPGASEQSVGSEPSGKDVADSKEQSERTGLRQDEPGGERRGRFGDSGSKGMADADNSGCNEQRRTESDEAQHQAIERRGWWESEPNVGRVAHGVPFRVDRLRALGNSVVPAQAREAFERLMGLK